MDSDWIEMLFLTCRTYYHIVILFILNVLGMKICQRRSVRVRDLKELPLEDNLHFLSERQSQIMKKMNDWLPCISFIITFTFCNRFCMDLIRNGLVFGIYKFIIASSTRLPPATRFGNEREVLFVPIATWIDYGISGHTGWCVLMWLHSLYFSSPVTYILLFVAIFTSFSMTMSKDHYTLDVLVAWPVAYAIHNLFKNNVKY